MSTSKKKGDAVYARVIRKSLAQLAKNIDEARANGLTVKFDSMDGPIDLSTAELEIFRHETL